MERKCSHRLRMSRFVMCLLLMFLFLNGCGNMHPQEDKDTLDEMEQTESNSSTDKIHQEETTTEGIQTEIPTRESTQGEDDDASDSAMFMNLMPNVTEDMLSEDYWLEKYKDSDHIIMTSEEIKKFNDNILYEKAERQKFLSYSQNDVDTIDKDSLTAIIKESEPWNQSYFEDGSEVGDDYWKKLIDNMNIDEIKEENTLLYGFAVQRESLYQFPTEDIITLDVPYLFFNENQISTILYGEPVIILDESKDDQWYYIVTETFGGWIKKEAVAISDSKKTWNIDRNPEHFLIVTDDECRLEYDADDEKLSELEFTLGCKLTLAKTDEYSKSAEGRYAYGNYVIKVPTRSQNGMVDWKYAFLPVGRNVHMGYLDYTVENVLKCAYSCLGNRYGWGGQYHARDCSQYLMEIFRCFGMILPRNTYGLSQSNCRQIDTEGMSDQEKSNSLKDMIPGITILYIKGHVMIYLGQKDNKNYVINSASSYIPENSEEVIYCQSVMINTLEGIKRKNGLSWIEAVEKIIILSE